MLVGACRAARRCLQPCLPHGCGNGTAATKTGGSPARVPQRSSPVSVPCRTVLAAWKCPAWGASSGEAGAGVRKTLRQPLEEDCNTLGSRFPTRSPKRCCLPRWVLVAAALWSAWAR